MITESILQTPEKLLTMLTEGSEPLVRDFLAKRHLLGLREISQPDVAIWTAQIAIFESFRLVEDANIIACGVNNMVLTGRGTHIDGSALLIMCALVLGVSPRCLELCYDANTRQSRVAYNNGSRIIAINWHDERDVKCYTAFKAQFNGQYGGWLHAQA